MRSAPATLAGLFSALQRFPPIVCTSFALHAGQLFFGLFPAPIALVWLGAGVLAAAADRRLFGRCLIFFAAPFALGGYQMNALYRPLPADHVVHAAGGRAQVQATVAARPERRGEGLRLVLDVQGVRKGGDWKPSRGRLQVTIVRATKEWMRGDRLLAFVRLRRPRNFGNPGQFDYQAYLARRSIFVTAHARTDSDWEYAGRDPNTWLGWIDRWRADVERIIDENLEGAARDIVAALIVGRQHVDAAIRDRYSRTGLAHILSISGLHIALVIGSTLAAARWLLARSEWLLLRTNVPKLAAAASIAPVTLYSALAGASTPTMRSAAAGLLWIAGILADRQRNWVTTISTAALAISVVWPGSVFEISFQLSFAAVIAILTGSARIRDWWAEREEKRLVRLRGGHWHRARAVALYLGVSLCAAAGTAPLTAWHFNQVSVISAFANPLLVPLFGLVPVGCGLCAAVITPFAPDLAANILRICGWIVAVADRLVALASLLPFASVRVPTPNAFELLAAYLLFAALLLRAPLRRILLRAAAAALLVALAFRLVNATPAGALRVTFLSVGHGDAALVEFPDGRSMLVDGGGLSPYFDAGERVIAPYLWYRAISRLDYVVLTHSDFDHYGGLSFIATTFRPREFWWNGIAAEGPAFEALHNALARSGAQKRLLRRGLSAEIAGTNILVLNPPQPPYGTENDDSVVLQLRYGPTAILLTGDIEAAAESALVATYGNTLRSSILKVPHHGSRTSSTNRFVAHVQPRFAVLSVGYDNRFGLPHPAVEKTYRENGATALRTDRVGAVTFDIYADGRLILHRHALVRRSLHH